MKITPSAALPLVTFDLADDRRVADPTPIQ